MLHFRWFGTKQSEQRNRIEFNSLERQRHINSIDFRTIITYRELMKRFNYSWLERLGHQRHTRKCSNFFVLLIFFCLYFLFFEIDSFFFNFLLEWCGSGLWSLDRIESHRSLGANYIQIHIATQWNRFSKPSTICSIAHEGIFCEMRNEIQFKRNKQLMFHSSFQIVSANVTPMMIKVLTCVTKTILSFPQIRRSRILN